MKRLLPLLFLLLPLVSCKNTWSDEDKAAFYEACTEDASHWAGSPEKAKTYCDCVLEKMMQKYPIEEDALAHINELISDTSMRQCRAAVMGE